MDVNLAILTTNSRNAENIILHFSAFENTKVKCIISSKENTELFKTLRRYKIDAQVTDSYKNIDEILTKHNIHYIILDGYEDKIPVNFCKKYNFKLINLHLLPTPDPLIFGDDKFKYIKNNHNGFVGINIYYVTSEYFNGLSVFRKTFALTPEHTESDIKIIVERLEKSYYPIIIEKIIKNTYQKIYGEV
jgi:folate-dependent phosphoribosylglycinamide formyltransferase PurN